MFGLLYHLLIKTLASTMRIRSATICNCGRGTKCACHLTTLVVIKLNFVSRDGVPVVVFKKFGEKMV